MYKLVDPVKNLAMDVHEYLDYDYRFALSVSSHNVNAGRELMIRS